MNLKKFLCSFLLAFPLLAAGESTVPNKVKCESLGDLAIPASAIGLPTTGASVTSATVVPASPLTVVGDHAVLALPEYCKVLGSISPVDPKAPKIEFLVNLPLAWNSKMIQLGGSGGNGSIPIALTTNMYWGPESIPPDSPYALARGFVTYGSDSGHQNGGGGGGARGASGAGGRGGSGGRGGRGNLAAGANGGSGGRGGRGNQAAGATGGRGAGGANDWVTNDEAFANFSYAQMKKTHDVTVAMIGKFYARPIRRSYYMGSSQGGREALIMVQRFPNDYDGVFSQVPALFYTHLGIEPIARAKPQVGDGWIPPAKVPTVANEIMRLCDDLDGIKDGLVSNYNACYQKVDATITPNPFSAIRCPGGADTGNTCLSDPQLVALNAVYARFQYPFPIANGITSFPGWSVGNEANGWKNFANKPTSDSASFSGFRARITSDPNVNFLEANLADYAKQIQALSAEMDPSNPDLSAFRKHGGKLILKTNTTDYTIDPRWLMEYYDRVVKTMGAKSVDSFVRFYIAVGLGHNRNVGRNPLTGAPQPGFVDFIAMLDDWVEHGKVPADKQVLTDVDLVPPFAVRSSFPMCRYPTYAKYDGKGDPKKAESYSCSAN